MNVNDIHQSHVQQCNICPAMSMLFSKSLVQQCNSCPAMSMLFSKSLFQQCSGSHMSSNVTVVQQCSGSHMSSNITVVQQCSGSHMSSNLNVVQQVTCPAMPFCPTMSLLSCKDSVVQHYVTTRLLFNLFMTYCM